MSRLFFRPVTTLKSHIRIKVPGCQRRQIYWALLEMRVSTPLPRGLADITIPAQKNQFISLQQRKVLSIRRTPACMSLRHAHFCTLKKTKGAPEYDNYVSQHTDISSRPLNFKPLVICFAAGVLPYVVCSDN